MTASGRVVDSKTFQWLFGGFGGAALLLAVQLAIPYLTSTESTVPDLSGTWRLVLTPSGENSTEVLGNATFVHDPKSNSLSWTAQISEIKGEGIFKVNSLFAGIQENKLYIIYENEPRREQGVIVAQLDGSHEPIAFEGVYRDLAPGPCSSLLGCDLNSDPCGTIEFVKMKVNG